MELLAQVNTALSTGIIWTLLELYAVGISIPLILMHILHLHFKKRRENKCQKEIKTAVCMKLQSDGKNVC